MLTSIIQEKKKKKQIQTSFSVSQSSRVTNVSQNEISLPSQYADLDLIIIFIDKLYFTTFIKCSCLEGLY